MSGSPLPDRKIRLHDFIQRYVEDYLKAKDPRSWRQELGRLRRIEEHFGPVWLDELDASSIEAFLAELRRRGYKPATLNRYHARLSSMMKRAWAWGYRTDNPLQHIERLRESRMGDRYLEPGEYRMLLEACDPDLRALVVVAAHTGLRRGELMSLRWQDIDLTAGLLVVRAEHSKTSESRVVPLNTEARRVFSNS
jgi:integrase